MAKQDFYMDVDMHGNQLLNAASNGGSASTYTAENKDSITLIKGTPVTQDGSGVGFIRASSSVNGSFCVGLVANNTAHLVSGPVQIDGVIELDDWTLIAGSISLIPKASYFLSSTPGKITSDPNSSPGLFLQKIGVSVDSQTLEILLGLTILL